MKQFKDIDDALAAEPWTVGCPLQVRFDNTKNEPPYRVTVRAIRHDGVHGTPLRIEDGIFDSLDDAVELAKEWCKHSKVVAWRIYGCASPRRLGLTKSSFCVPYLTDKLHDELLESGEWWK